MKPQVKFRSGLFLLPGIVSLQRAFLGNPSISATDYLMAEIAWREFIEKERGMIVHRLCYRYEN